MRFPDHTTDWRCFSDALRFWRVDTKTGYVQQINAGSTGRDAISVQRTRGYPKTVERIYQEKYHDDIELACDLLKDACDKDIMRRTLVMMIATESRGVNGPEGRREEPGFETDDATPHRVSGGIMHTLLSTARNALGMPEMKFEQLYTPLMSILAGALYLIETRDMHEFDPVLALATYNAGKPRYSTKNDWALVCNQWSGQEKTHIDWGLSFYNDFVYWQAEVEGM